MLFFTFFASPNIPWMLFWLGAGFFMSERHRLTFVIPFITTLLGYTDATVIYILLVWLCDFADKPLFTSDTGKGQVNTWLEKAFSSFAPFKKKREESSLLDKHNPQIEVEPEKEKSAWRVSPKKIKDKFLKI